jgi:hypothetical protein
VDSTGSYHTFEMKEDVGLIVLEHLCDQLYIHVLHVDLEQILVEHHNSLIEFLLELFEQLPRGKG